MTRVELKSPGAPLAAVLTLPLGVALFGSVAFAPFARLDLGSVLGFAVAAALGASMLVWTAYATWGRCVIEREGESIAVAKQLRTWRRETRFRRADIVDVRIDPQPWTWEQDVFVLVNLVGRRLPLNLTLGMRAKREQIDAIIALLDVPYDDRRDDRKR